MMDKYDKMFWLDYFDDLRSELMMELGSYKEGSEVFDIISNLFYCVCVSKARMEGVKER